LWGEGDNGTLLGCLNVVSVGDLGRWSCGGVVDVGSVGFRGGVKVVSGGIGVNYGGAVGSVCFGGD
jgi:hypothetical protein